LTELYYLVANANGFEEPVKMGPHAELGPLRRDLELREHATRTTDGVHSPWSRISYYLVPKEEWDREHCPLMPVDLS
jgi:hypothetical protein